MYNSRSGAIEDTDHFHREISARRALMTGSVLHCTALYWFKNNGGAGTRKVCVLRDGTRDKRRPMGRAARESVHLIFKKIGDRDPYITVLSRDVTRTKTLTTTQH